MSSSRAGGDPGSLDTRGGGASRQRRAAADLGRAGVCGKIQPGANMYQLLADWVWREKFSISTAMTAQKVRRMIFSALASTTTPRVDTSGDFSACTRRQRANDYESGAPATGTGAFLAALSVTAALAAAGIGAW